MTKARFVHVHPAERPGDGVVVALAQAGGKLVAAEVSWPDRVIGGTRYSGGREEAPSVVAALNRGCDLAGQYGFAYVGVALKDRSLWQPEWGLLE
jgi:hypothetical protein